MHDAVQMHDAGFRGCVWSCIDTALPLSSGAATRIPWCCCTRHWDMQDIISPAARGNCVCVPATCSGCVLGVTAGCSAMWRCASETGQHKLIGLASAGLWSGIESLYASHDSMKRKECAPGNALKKQKASQSRHRVLAQPPARSARLTFTRFEREQVQRPPHHGLGAGALVAS